MTTFTNNARLQAFLYTLVRDHLPLGKVEAIVADLETSEDVTPIFSEPNLACWAASLIHRLVMIPDLFVMAQGGRFTEEQIQRFEKAIRDHVPGKIEVVHECETCGTAKGRAHVVVEGETCAMCGVPDDDLRLRAICSGCRSPK